MGGRGRPGNVNPVWRLQDRPPKRRSDESPDSPRALDRRQACTCERVGPDALAALRGQGVVVAAGLCWAGVPAHRGELAGITGKLRVVDLDRDGVGGHRSSSGDGPGSTWRRWLNMATWRSQAS